MLIYHRGRQKRGAVVTSIFSKYRIGTICPSNSPPPTPKKRKEFSKDKKKVQFYRKQKKNIHSQYNNNSNKKKNASQRQGDVRCNPCCRAQRHTQCILRGPINRQLGLGDWIFNNLLMQRLKPKTNKSGLDCSRRWPFSLTIVLCAYVGWRAILVSSMRILQIRSEKERKKKENYTLQGLGGHEISFLDSHHHYYR